MTAQEPIRGRVIHAAVNNAVWSAALALPAVAVREFGGDARRWPMRCGCWFCSSWSLLR